MGQYRLPPQVGQPATLTWTPADIPPEASLGGVDSEVRLTIRQSATKKVTYSTGGHSPDDGVEVLLNPFPEGGEYEITFVRPSFVDVATTPALDGSAGFGATLETRILVGE